MAYELTEDQVESLRYARTMRDRWKDQYDELVDDIVELSGAADELTHKGRVVFTYNRTRAFQTRAFEKDHPEAFRFYTKTRKVEETYLDVDALKDGRPELFEAYQSRSFRPVGD